MERQGGEQWKGQGFPVEPGMTRDKNWNDGERAKEMTRKRTGMTERKQRENSGKGEGSPGEGRRKMKEGWNKAG